MKPKSEVQLEKAGQMQMSRLASWIARLVRNTSYLSNSL